MNKISAVIITNNEEKNIVRCIQSLIEVADEILVVDSGSTDSTVKIAEELSAKVLYHSWIGYSEQKNWANQQAAFDWILSIDADEALSEKLISELKALKSVSLNGAYWMPRLTNYCGQWIRHGDWYPDYKLRIWNRKEGGWQGLIHEEVILQSDVLAIKLKGNLLHYSYGSIMEHVEQMKRFTLLMAQNNVDNKKKASVVKIFVSPIIKFIKSYIIKKGFLDGYYGFVVAIMSAHATFLKYAYTRELERKG